MSLKIKSHFHRAGRKGVIFAIDKREIPKESSWYLKEPGVLKKNTVPGILRILKLVILVIILVFWKALAQSLVC